MPPGHCDTQVLFRKEVPLRQVRHTLSEVQVMQEFAHALVERTRGFR